MENMSKSMCSKLDDDPKSQGNNRIKIAFLNSPETTDLNVTAELTESLDLEDVWANKSEISKWIGPIPINEYPINVDPNPIIIKKEFKKKFECNRKVYVKYLEPTTQLGEPGNIIVNQEVNIRPPEAPPLHMYQTPVLQPTLKPLIIRERPPTPPPIPPQKIITIPGKLLPTPPRTIIYEKIVNHPCNHPCMLCERYNGGGQYLKECTNFNRNSNMNYDVNTKARLSYLSMNDYKNKYFSKMSNPNFSIGNFSYNNVNNMVSMKNSLRSSGLNI